jgi:hypothetical protein
MHLCVSNVMLPRIWRYNLLKYNIFRESSIYYWVFLSLSFLFDAFLFFHSTSFIVFFLSFFWPPPPMIPHQARGQGS